MCRDNYLFFHKLFRRGIFPFFPLLFLFWMSTSVHAQEELSKGRVVYERYCVICHGEKGDGQGLIASLFHAKPRNFIIRRV